MAAKNEEKVFIFVTFVLCCLSVALIASAYGTEGWVNADQLSSTDPKGHGSAHFGLFTGETYFFILTPVTKTYHIVCLSQLCMYSSEPTEELREASLDLIISNSTVDGDTAQELMSEGLWVATIVMLSLALFFAILGAIFAVVNTATTPIEFITGVPGLYIWNGCAAILGIACVSCWAAQYRTHLKHNVLVEDSDDGWTTESLENLGYSYWLVVVSVLVHVANCILIAVGTYERKIKTQYEAPETKTGNIMLY